MFSTLFKRKDKTRTESASKFLKQPHIQEYMTKVRKINKAEANDSKRLEEWTKKKNEAIKNVDIELLNQLCEEIADVHRHLADKWYYAARLDQKLRAKFKQIAK